MNIFNIAIYAVTFLFAIAGLLTAYPLSGFEAYRKWRQGYWVYTHFIGWEKVSKKAYFNKARERGSFVTLEKYT